MILSETGSHFSGSCATQLRSAPAPRPCSADPKDPPGQSPSGRVTLFPCSLAFRISVAHHLGFAGGLAAARMPDDLKIRLQGPAGHDHSDISKFEIGLIVANRSRHHTEIDLVLIEGARTVGEARIDDARAETIFRPARQQSREHDPTVDIGVEQITVRRAQRRAAEYGYAAVRRAILRAINLLIDNAVDPEVAAMLGRNSAPRRIGEQ